MRQVPCWQTPSPIYPKVKEVAETRPSGTHTVFPRHSSMKNTHLEKGIMLGRGLLIVRRPGLEY